jgi:hypothetical protein
MFTLLLTRGLFRYATLHVLTENFWKKNLEKIWGKNLDFFLKKCKLAIEFRVGLQREIFVSICIVIVAHFICFSRATI